MSVLHHEDMLQDLYEETAAEFPNSSPEAIEKITLERWNNDIDFLRWDR